MRPVPTGWGMPLYSGDLWAACRVAVRDYQTWAELPPDEAWEDQDPDATWDQDTAPSTVLSPDRGSISKDWAGPGQRTSATIELPLTDPNIAQVTQNRWIAIHGYLVPPVDARDFSIDLDLVPYVVVADLFITGLEHNQTDGTVTVSADDLVTLLGARQLDTGTGPTGYLPTARTVHGVIRELVTRYAPLETLVTVTGAPDAPWAPTLDNDQHPEPLTGTVWSAIEELALLAGITVTADGPHLALGPSNSNPVHSGLTITETPAASGIQAVTARRQTAPAVTDVIATGSNPTGDRVAGRAHDPATQAQQGFQWDATISVPGQVDQTQATLAAIAHLDYLRGQQTSGALEVPWLPFLEPGDVITVAWETGPTDAHYLDSVTIPLNPAEPIPLTLRGGSWPTWADEPPGNTWADLDPALTWAQDT